MKKELVQIKLHGHLGKSVKKSNWSLAVKSVSEAINAIKVKLIIVLKKD